MIPLITGFHTAVARVRYWDWAQAVCVKACQLLVPCGRSVFSSGYPISSISETDISSSSFHCLDMTLAVAEA